MFVLCMSSRANIQDVLIMSQFISEFPQTICSDVNFLTARKGFNGGLQLDRNQR